MAAPRIPPGSKDLGKWIARRREDLGVLQKEMAERLGVSVLTLRRVERGQRGFRNDGEVVMYARALEVEEDELRRVAGQGPPEDATPTGDSLSAYELREMLKRLQADVERAMREALSRFGEEGAEEDRRQRPADHPLEGLSDSVSAPDDTGAPTSEADDGGEQRRRRAGRQGRG